MIEILEKVSDQVQKVENLHSESILVIEREYPTPPVSQTRITIPVEYYLEPTHGFQGRSQCQVQKGQ